MKFKMCRKCKKGFFLENKLHIHLKSCKDKFKDVNQIANKLKNNPQKTFLIVIISFIIVFINENELNIDK